MRISIAPGRSLEDGSAVYLLVADKVVISSHPTVSDAIRARRNVELTTDYESRPAPNSVTMATDRATSPHQ